ncbi:MAG: DUF481 domain-containing protein [Opitutaceae bacterium]
MQHLIKPSRALLALTLAALALTRLSADVVETKNGARIVGKVSSIDAGTVVVATDFAGSIKIKQSEVASITTDAPIAVKLASGDRIDGRVSGGGNGALQVAGASGPVNTTVAQVASSWAAGQPDPSLVRHWAYQATVDVAGKTGNKEQLGTAAAFRAVLKTPQDMLQFYSAYNREVSEGVKSADQFKAGVDYQNNFAGNTSWYVRDEGGFDRVKDIKLYNVAGAGFGYDVFREPKHLLTTRAGLSFRYEDYKNPATTDVSSMGLDIGLNHEWEFSNSRIVNRLSYVPSFEDFSNYRINHESFYEIPLADPSWKLRLGISNDYNSKPGTGVKRLDTAYFTRFVLSWQ